MLSQIELKDVKITGGYLYEKQRMNEQVTIPATYKQFQSTGRVDAFKLKWRAGQPNQPHFFWDSDVAKWIEGAAYTLVHQRDENLEGLIDSVINDLIAGQTREGYFNIYYQTFELANRFTNRENHELYCAGHLIEAAVAYKRATGKDALLQAMVRYVDYIYDVFTAPERDRNFVTPGHEEIELALVRLYHETKIKKHLELSRFFINSRGTLDGEKGTFKNWASKYYAQDHLPIAEQTTAEGHAVRCLYMLSGAADITREYGDEKLKKACEAVFDNIVNKRMYVTGGIGGNFSGEAFSYDYDLPGELAYAETCASVAMIFFCQRMYLITGENKYIDVMELQLYNGFLSGISLRGDTFFYCNPLEVHPERRDYFAQIRNSQFAPEYERPEYFGCSCCPPNIIRLISSLGQYMYHVDEDNRVYVNLFNSSEFEHNGTKIIQETDYPRDGDVKLTVITHKPVELMLRSPAWCHNINIRAEYDSDIYEEGNDYMLKNGYYKVRYNQPGEYKLCIQFDMPVVELYASPKVHHCAGRVAVKRGPVVYCAEGVDNGDNLKSIRICGDPNYACEQSSIDGNSIVKVTCDCEAVAESSDALYSETPFAKEQKRLTLIPYAAWANRGRTEMLVWMMK